MTTITEYSKIKTQKTTIFSLYSKSFTFVYKTFKSNKERKNPCVMKSFLIYKVNSDLKGKLQTY